MRFAVSFGFLVLGSSLLGCGESGPPGTKLRLRELPGKVLQVGFGVDCSSQDATGCTGRFGLGLDYSFPDCAVVPAEVRVQGIPVTQSRTGGWEYCPAFSFDSEDCKRYCWQPSWEGPITSVLDQIAKSAQIEIDDGDSTLVLVVDHPTATATIAPRGLRPGDAVKDGDIFIADLAPVYPTTAEEFRPDTTGHAKSEIAVRLYQGNYPFDPPGSTMDPQSKDGPWAFEIGMYMSYVSPQQMAGPGTLEFTLRTQLSFSICPTSTACAGGIGRKMLEFPIVYAP